VPRLQVKIVLTVALLPLFACACAPLRRVFQSEEIFSMCYISWLCPMPSFPRNSAALV